MMRKIRIFLRLYIIFLIVSLSNNLFAQAQQEEVKDPFLSMGDKIRLSQRSLDISQLPYPIVLNGIIWNENVQLAIINGETVEKNQPWKDFRVEEIKKDRVILGLGENRFEIVLPSEEDNEKKKE